MKTRTVCLLAFLVAVAISLPAFAADSGHGNMKGMDHGSMKGMDHDKMMSQEGMMMLGDDTEEDVKGRAHLNDVGEAMKKMGMSETHHFMILFEDIKTGKAITEGQAAVKITGPDGKTSKPIMLMGMEGHFGSDITLTQKGEYKFEVGTKLPDGQKRQFEFEQTLK